MGKQAHIRAEYFRYDFGDIFKHLPDIAKLVGIGGWGTILGLVGIDVLAARLHKEGLELVEASENCA